MDMDERNYVRSFESDASSFISSDGRYITLIMKCDIRVTVTHYSPAHITLDAYYSSPEERETEKEIEELSFVACDETGEDIELTGDDYAYARRLTDNWAERCCEQCD